MTRGCGMLVLTKKLAGSGEAGSCVTKSGSRISETTAHPGFSIRPHPARFQNVVGDLFMSLIHTCELNGVNSFRDLTELQRYSSDVKRTPADWMPWNYGETLARMARIQSLAAA